MLATLQKLTDRLIGLSALIGTARSLFVVGVIIVDVVGRNFGRPLYGSQDLITMTMVLIVFGGMALCDRVGGHIIVDIFERIVSSLGEPRHRHRLGPAGRGHLRHDRLYRLQQRAAEPDAELVDQLAAPAAVLVPVRALRLRHHRVGWPCSCVRSRF